MSDIWFAIFFKHFVCDFPLQWRYQYANKGIYGHPGGLLHAAIHALGMGSICLWFALPLWLMLADAFLHYHIDWAKVHINARYGLTPTNSEQFWWLLGFDQFLHYGCYIMLLYLGGR